MLIGSIALVVTLLSLRLHDEIFDGFKHHLRSAAIKCCECPFKRRKRTPEAIAAQLGLKDLVYLPLETAIPNDPYSQIAPVYGIENKHIGHIIASGHSQAIDKKFRESLFLVFVSGQLSCWTPHCHTLYQLQVVSLCRCKSSNNSALAIAAGHYGESASIGGPKEIADLANTPQLQ